MPSFESLTSSLLWLACLLVPALLVVSLFSQRVRNLPPGPTADPIIGHARLIPIDYQWKTFDAWKKKYGPHFCVIEPDNLPDLRHC